MRLLKLPSWFFGLLKALTCFLFVRIIYLLLRKRSFSTRFNSVILIAFLFYHVIYRKGAKRIKRNISLIRPDLNEKEINQGAWRLAKTIARSWAAMLGNEFTSMEEVTRKVEVKNPEILLKRYNEGEKIIATAVHVGPVDEMIGII